MEISSNPHAWLRPLYARLRSDQRFGLLSPAHQFEALAKAVEEDSPAKAATMREWSPAMQVGLIGWLSDVVREQPNPVNETELWRVRGRRSRATVCCGLLAERNRCAADGRRGLSAHAVGARCAGMRGAIAEEESSPY
jgi:hypothetical protein